MYLVFLVLPHDCKNEQKNTFVTTFNVELLRAGNIILFFFAALLCFCLENGFNTYGQFVQKAQRSCFFFLLLCCPFGSQTTKVTKKRRRRKKLFIRRAHLRPQKQEIRIYFGLAAIYYMPYHNIVLSFWTRWIIIHTFADVVCITRKIFSFSNKRRKKDETKNRNKKSIRRKTLTCFSSVSVFGFCCTIAAFYASTSLFQNLNRHEYWNKNTIQNKKIHVVFFATFYSSIFTVECHIMLHKRKTRDPINIK